MNTHQKGETALLQVQMRAMENGVILSRPTVEGTRYDLVLDTGGKLERVQVKYGNGSSTQSEGASVVNLTRNNNGTKKVRKYTAEEVDVLLVYVPAIDKVCRFEPKHFAGKSALSIRHTKAKNGQTKNCLMADEYEW